MQMSLLLLEKTVFEDENIIMNSIVSLMKELNDLSLIWAYHEPKNRYLDSAETFFRSKDFSVERLSKTNPDKLKARVCLVDSIGQLANLYWYGQIAYIGGGFSTGVHNVMEPAIARLPIFFGPRYNNSNEAEELIIDGGVPTVTNVTSTKSDGLYKAGDIIPIDVTTNVVHRNLGSSTRVVRNIIHD